MAQPYQELSIFWGEGYLDNDTLNSPEQFWIIWLLLLASLGLIIHFFFWILGVLIHIPLWVCQRDQIWP